MTKIIEKTNLNVSICSLFKKIEKLEFKYAFEITITKFLWHKQIKFFENN